MNLIGVTPPVAAPPGNLALDKLATASSVYLAFTPDRAVDGTAISPSFWRSAGVSKDLPNTWLRVDLGAAFTPTRAVVTWKENYFARNYRFQVSNTGGSADSEWTTVSTTTGALGTQNVLLTTPFPARYFRIRMDRNNKLNNQIFELEVYAD